MGLMEGEDEVGKRGGWGGGGVQKGARVSPPVARQVAKRGHLVWSNRPVFG
jgi:hypothetical protein